MKIYNIMAQLNVFIHSISRLFAEYYCSELAKPNCFVIKTQSAFDFACRICFVLIILL